VEADPIRLNANLGHYTNFMNLLDLAAVAVPAGMTEAGLPFGITLFAPAFADASLLALAERFHHGQSLSLGATRHPLPASAREEYAPAGTLALAVCGAHLSGLALNHQLTERGAFLLERTRTAPFYHLYALAGGPPQRPGLVRAANGAAIELEVWAVPLAQVGSFLAGIPAPLGLGKVELEDGRWVTGFICEGQGVEGATDITASGGWRAWLEESALVPREGSGLGRTRRRVRKIHGFIAGNVRGQSPLLHAPYPSSRRMPGSMWLVPLDSGMRRTRSNYPCSFRTTCARVCPSTGPDPARRITRRLPCTRPIQ
jgi:hypothetical protein